MPSRVGHLTAVFEDGHVRARNELSGEEWFGRIVIGSGGMLLFDIVDERNITVGQHIMEPEKQADDVNRGTQAADDGRVTVGRRKRAPAAAE